MPTPTRNHPRGGASTAPRRYRPTDPEEEIFLFELSDGYQLKQIRNHEGYWRVGCTCPDYKMVKPGQAAICVHVENGLKEHLDVRPGYILDPNVQVVCCKKPGITVNLILEDRDEAGFRKVWSTRLSGHQLVNGIREWEEHEMISYTHVSSGRWELRAMALEWLMGAVSRWEGSTCSAPHHIAGLSPIENVYKHLSAKGLPDMRVLADVFDLETTAKCRRCNEDEGIPDLSV